LLTDLLAAVTTGAPRYADVLAAFKALSITEQHKAIQGDLARLTEDECVAVIKVLGVTFARPFIPMPGPQTTAYHSLADEVLYGGAAGGGKSKLLLGCAAINHKRALILRRQSTELDGLVGELNDMLGRDGWRSEGSGGTHTVGDRVIRLGGCREPDDWRHFAGRARDYLGIDEAGEFLEEQVSSLIGWVRSTDPNQRCRVILASNPPRGAEGQWLLEWFAPWLDTGFPNPAQPGELRWFIGVKGKTKWVAGPGGYEVDGEQYTARSRTFIPALLDDNPFLARTNYRATLQSLPEPLRSQLLKGDFLAGREDDAWQVIPSDWIQKARLRWTPEPPPGVTMTSMGVDVAQGGPDRTALAPRHGRWFAPVSAVDGVDTSSGPAVAALVFGAMRDGCTIVVDMGGGWGGSAYDHLRHQLPDDSVVGFLGSASSDAKTVNGIESFANKRAEAWWRFREALDPDTGASIALPPDPELAAELAMPRRIPERREIQIERKVDIIKRLGRSPDKADAVVMAWAYGDERAMQRFSPQRMQTHSIVGRASAKRYGRGR
jgi:hypothetical protein